MSTAIEQGQVEFSINEIGVATIEFGHPLSNSLPGKILQKLADTIRYKVADKTLFTAYPTEADAEVYFDGKIVKVVKLDGVPSITNTHLYSMYDNTFGGEISNLIYYPEPLKLPNINSILTLAPAI